MHLCAWKDVFFILESSIYRSGWHDHCCIEIRPSFLANLLWDHDDIIKGKHFARYWFFMMGIHRWRGTLIFSFICAWKRLSKQSRRRWFETPSRPLWRHCNVMTPLGQLAISGLWNGMAWRLRWHLNQCWLTDKWTIRNNVQWNLNQSRNVYIFQMNLKVMADYLLHVRISHFMYIMKTNEN